jgi:predicted RNase H-like nuclease (RuvC/YqgF family)
MLSMQQLEELEARVIKALQLISDLRTENSRLESDAEHYKAEAEEARLSLEEKEQEILRIQNELDDTTRQLAELREKEEILEKKVIALLGKMDGLQGGGSIPKGDSIPRSSASGFASSDRKPASSKLDADDDIVIIDDDAPQSRTAAPATSAHDDSEIILLDEDEDEIVIDDADEDSIIVDETDNGEEIKVDDDDDFIIIEEEEEPKKKK